MDSRTAETVHLCSEPECVDSTVTFGITGHRKPHLPNHRMFKVRRYIFSRDIARIQKAAMEVLELERENFAWSKKEGGPIRECMSCKSMVSPPKNV